MLKSVGMLAVIFAIIATITATTTPEVRATSINCHHTGPIVGHHGMEYICYVYHDDAPMEIFYAPGPNARP
jgi:hypothetical protein